MATRPPPQVRGRRPFRERVKSRIAHLSFLAMRPMTLGVRGVVIDAEGAVLLVRHSYVAGWHFPGGGVEPGETCESALTRELAEEANVVAEPPMQLHGLYFNAHASRRDHVAVYIVRRFRFLGARAPDREILAVRFFAPEALPEDATRGTRARLAEILHSQPLAAHW
jgi:8-oxo-dGTP pyrophosphatase MutT (NUDIX family)